MLRTQKGMNRRRRRFILGVQSLFNETERDYVVVYVYLREREREGVGITCVEKLLFFNFERKNGFLACSREMDKG